MINQPLDLDLLRAFVEVADARSFTAAASRLGRVQSAVSMQIRRLEETTGSRLLERTPRSVALTAEGERLLSYARRMLRLSEEALADLGRSSPEGIVRFGTTDIASVFLPGILSRFAAGYPRVEMEVVCDRSWHLLDALEAGRLDVAVVTQRCGRSDGLTVFREPLGWGYSRNHAAHAQTPLPLALFAAGCAYRDAAMAALDGADIPWRAAYNSASLPGVIAAVEAGLAVAPLSLSMLNDRMALLPPDRGLPALPDFELSVHSSEEHLSDASRYLVRAIGEGLQERRG